jgi:hypothetical protein
MQLLSNNLESSNRVPSIYNDHESSYSYRDDNSNVSGSNYEAGGGGGNAQLSEDDYKEIMNIYKQQEKSQYNHEDSIIVDDKEDELQESMSVNGSYKKNKHLIFNQNSVYFSKGDSLTYGTDTFESSSTGGENKLVSKFHALGGKYKKPGKHLAMNLKGQNKNQHDTSAYPSGNNLSNIKESSPKNEISDPTLD